MIPWPGADPTTWPDTVFPAEHAPWNVAPATLRMFADTAGPPVGAKNLKFRAPLAAFVAFCALVAFGTTPSVDSLIWVPVRVSFLTFPPLIDVFAYFVLVTAPAASFCVLTAPFAILGAVTAPSLMSFVPTCWAAA